MSEYAGKILNAIKETKTSYEELSQKTGIPKSTLQRFATGQTKKISIPRLEAIAVALGLKADYLLGWDKDLPSKEEKPIPENELNKELVSLLADLTPQETTRVADFVSGLKAARAEAASLHKKGQK